MKSAFFYRCKHCGNLVAMVHSGGGTLTCCGEPMELLKANSTDASQEKHVPVLSVNGRRLKAVVGSAEHPMTEEHYIEWIALQDGERLEVIYLKPGDKPQAEFDYLPHSEKEEVFVDENDELVPNCEGNPCNFVLPEHKGSAPVVYAYCNLHGLWQAQL